MKGGRLLILLHTYRVILSRGFTLIEVLMAVAILSLVVGLTYGTFWTTMRTMDESRQTMECSQEAGLILSAMERSLCGARDRVGFAGKNRTISGKDADTLEFSSTSSGWDAAAGIVRVRYFPDEEGYLWQAVEGKPLCLTENLEGINFYYRQRESKGEWTGSWDAENGVLPAAVKVVLTIGNSSFSSVVVLPK